MSYSKDDCSFTFAGCDDAVWNLGGRFGAYFSDIFLKLLGYPAYLVPVIFLVVGYRLFRYKRAPLAGFENGSRDGSWAYPDRCLWGGAVVFLGQCTGNAI